LQEGLQTLLPIRGLAADERASNPEPFPAAKDGIIIVAYIARLGMGIVLNRCWLCRPLDLQQAWSFIIRERPAMVRERQPSTAWMVYGLQDVHHNCANAGKHSQM